VGVFHTLTKPKGGFGDPNGAQNGPEKSSQAKCSTPLPRLTHKSLRSAGNTFSHRTTATYDGVYPRHFALLSDSALKVIGIFLENIEKCGTWPSGIDTVAIALIPKPKGGVRPIGLFPGLHRLWTRARRDVTQAWEDEHNRSYFAARKGNRAIYTVWRQSLEAEISTANQRSTASVLIDLRSFFDHLNHADLAARAEEAGFNFNVTRLAISAYRHPRALCKKGVLAAPLFPTRGVLAGCGLASTMIKIYCLKAFDQFKMQWGGEVSLDTYIDDLTLTVVAATDDEVRSILVGATAALRALIEADLKCSIALEKRLSWRRAGNWPMPLQKRSPSLEPPLRLLLLT